MLRFSLGLAPLYPNDKHIPERPVCKDDRSPNLCVHEDGRSVSPVPVMGMACGSRFPLSLRSRCCCRIYPTWLSTPGKLLIVVCINIMKAEKLG